MKPLALLVLLENVGHISGLNLPSPVRAAVDFVSEAYAKALLRLYGAYRAYDRVVILEDAEARGPQLVAALSETSRTHTTDVFLLVHGLRGALVGFRGEPLGKETFGPLLAAGAELRVVYGLNCYGSSLTGTWHALGARVVCGARGVNWFPEPGLSGFLLAWLGGCTFGEAVERSNRAVRWTAARLFGRNSAAFQSSELHLSGDAGLRLREPAAPVDQDDAADSDQSAYEREGARHLTE